MLLTSPSVSTILPNRTYTVATTGEVRSPWGTITYPVAHLQTDTGWVPLYHPVAVRQMLLLDYHVATPVLQKDWFGGGFANFIPSPYQGPRALTLTSPPNPETGEEEVRQVDVEVDGVITAAYEYHGDEKPPELPVDVSMGDTLEALTSLRFMDIPSP